MNLPSIFWVIILSLALCFFVLSFREALNLMRMQQGHPERGLYWFNAFFLLLASVFVVIGGLYLDHPRVEFTEIWEVPVSARYAHERNALVRGERWNFITEASEGEVRRAHAVSARAQGYPHIDGGVGAPIVLALPTGDLYLTIVDAGSKRLLFYSREGTTTPIVLPSDSVE